ncbi:MAG: hypothetical protein IPP48_15005 [Chitinophagaceae bacterium]|nr:hypothetical protein [Chitinophagaceae bacterium]
MIKNLRYILLLTIFASCKFYAKKPKDNLLDEKIKMLDADKAFSQLSEEKGMKTAFMEYIDSNGFYSGQTKCPLLEPMPLIILASKTIRTIH